MDDKEKDSLQTPDNLPEAGASATVKVKSSKNFEWLFTVRDNSSKTLLFKIDALEKHFMANGFTPLAQNQSKFPPKPEKPPVQFVEGQSCPTCGSPLVYAQKKDGTRYIKCSTNKWNPLTKQPEGCNYVRWN